MGCQATSSTGAEHCIPEQARLPHQRGEFILRQLLRAPSKGINSPRISNTPLCSQSQKKRKEKKSLGQRLQVWAVSRFLQVEMKAKGTWLSTERACGDSVVSLWFRSLGGAPYPPVARGCGPAGSYPVHDLQGHLRGEQCGDCPLAETSEVAKPIFGPLRLGAPKAGLIEGLGNQNFLWSEFKNFGRRILQILSKLKILFAVIFTACMHTSGSLPDTPSPIYFFAS